MKMVSLKQPYNQITKSLLCPQHTQYNGKLYRCTSGTSRKEGFGSGRVSPLVPVQSRTGTHGAIYPGS